MSAFAEIEKYRNDYRMIAETAEQLRKDFGMFSVEIHFSGNPDTAYDELFRQVRAVIEPLAAQNSSVFGNILYRVDIREKDLAEVYRVQPPSAMYDVLTDLILRRELFKVVCRRYYSDPGK